MRTGDQWFKAGDKVMRVTPGHVPGTFNGECHDWPIMGVVYCVEDFYEGPHFNVVMLVGFGGWRRDAAGRPVGWGAIHFRKVEEIKLCVNAAMRANAPVHVHNPSVDLKA